MEGPRTVMFFFLLACVFTGVKGYYVDEPILYEKFPEDFAWGTATSAYQIEGGYDEDGKGMSSWDYFSHQPGAIVDNSTGDVACDSYHKWEDDIAILSNLGATHYRFSIAWTRILPNGIGDVNQNGINYYNNLINGLLAEGIEPMVTMYHWDTPLALEGQGGWLSDQSPEWFEEYAGVLFREFGDRVKLWITFNEPWVTCLYSVGNENPKGVTCYQCGHHIIQSHVRAYRLYERDFAAQQGGQVGITLNSNMAFPNSQSEEDIAAADRNLMFNVGWFAHPLTVNGNYPEIMIDKIGEKSEAQGYPESRLPMFTDDEIQSNLGAADFLGINHYSSNFAFNQIKDINDVSFGGDSDVGFSGDGAWYSMDWIAIVPTGIRGLLTWMDAQFQKPIYVTENGIVDMSGNLDDMWRLYYYKYYINNVLKAVVEDGANVKGYMAWSLMDNFEWTSGYTLKYGVHRVDFEDPDRPRTLKASGAFLKEIIANNGYVENPACLY